MCHYEYYPRDTHSGVELLEEGEVDYISKKLPQFAVKRLTWPATGGTILAGTFRPSGRWAPGSGLSYSPSKASPLWEGGNRLIEEARFCFQKTWTLSPRTMKKPRDYRSLILI